MSALLKWLERRRPEPSSVNFGPIGVYLSKENLQVVQLQHVSNGSLEIRSHVSLRYPGSRADLLSSQGAVQKLVRRAMKAGNFRGRTVVSAMPPEQVRVMSVSYPANNAGNDVGAITRLMSDRLEGELRDYVIDYVPIRMSSNDGDRMALVAVSNIEHVNGYLAALDSAGLHVDHLEIGPVAIQRLIKWGSTPNQFGNVIVVSIGDTSSKVTTISGNCLLADQEIKFCETTILHALEESLNLDQAQVRALVLANGFSTAAEPETLTGTECDPEITATLIEIAKPAFLELAREIERAFLYADSESHGDGTKQLIVTGGAARWPGAISLLGSLTKVKVELLDRNRLPPSNETDAGEGDSIDHQSAAEMSTAVGLAMRGMLSDE